MKHYIVEQWSYKPAWLALSEQQRRDFVSGIGKAVEQMAAAGIQTLGFGRIDHALDRAVANFDFWSLWAMDSIEARDEFLSGVAASGWYEYFEHANVGGALVAPEELLLSHIQAS